VRHLVLEVGGKVVLSGAAFAGGLRAVDFPTLLLQAPDTDGTSVFQLLPKYPATLDDAVPVSWKDMAFLSMLQSDAACAQFSVGHGGYRQWRGALPGATWVLYDAILKESHSEVTSL